MNWYRCWVREDGTPTEPVAVGFNVDGHQRSLDAAGNTLFGAWAADIQLTCGDCGATATLTVTNDRQIRNPLHELGLGGRQMHRISWSRCYVSLEVEPGWRETKQRDLCPTCYAVYIAELRELNEAGIEDLPVRRQR